jgi:hypothetical protein
MWELLHIEYVRVVLRISVSQKRAKVCALPA